VNFTNIVVSTSAYSMALMGSASQNRNIAVEKEDGCKGLQARAYFVAQMIVSIAALPLLFLGTLLLAPLALCLGKKGDAWAMLQAGAGLELLHLSLIPTCLIAAFAPHSAKCHQPFKAAFDCLRK
jgi:hypothetical protein